MQKINETLFGLDKKGGAKQWSVYVEGGSVIVEWGKVGGVLSVKETPCKPKNIGRVNETTAEQQALSQATSKWDKQYKSKFYRPTIEEAREAETEGVMLSHKFIEKGHLLPQIVCESPKLDGLRVKSTRDGELISRGNDRYPLFDHMRDELADLHEKFDLEFLDGEMYCHGMRFEDIVSNARKYHEGESEKLVYNIFDAPMKDVTFKDRWAILKKIAGYIEDNGYTSVAVVPHKWCDKEEYKSLNTEYVSQGYEGVMFNDPDGFYEFQNHRSNGIQKYKVFDDSEARIISCAEDLNNETVFTCEWTTPDGIDVNFDVKMRGSHESREFNESKKEWIGKWITFRYQGVGVNNKPRFPVGICERRMDQEGNPID